MNLSEIVRDTNVVGHDSHVHSTAIVRNVRLGAYVAIAERLMTLAWWDRPYERLKAAFLDVQRLDAEAFLERSDAR